MGQLIMLEPDHRPQFEVDILGNIKKGLKKLANGLKELTKTTEKTSTVYLYGQKISLVEVQSLKAQLHEYYGQTKVYKVDIRKLYDTIQEDLVLILVPYVDAFGGSSFEEILKAAMDLARMANNPIIRGVDMLPALDNLLETDLIDSDSFGVQRISLAIIWSALLLALFSKWTSICSSEKNRLIKGGIALALSIGVEFVQFCHKSPESVTNYLRMLYEGYNNVRDKYNQLHEKQIPDILKMNSPRVDFAIMTGKERITTGQVLNMVYTFRVGDITLSVLEKENRGFWVSDDICKKLIESIIPAPVQAETDKIYKLYTEPSIYIIN